MVENNLKRLKANLLQKNALLEQLQKLYDEQAMLLDGSSMETESFDVCMDKQDELLHEFEALNEDADKLYEQLRLTEFLADGPYEIQIEELKSLIAQITVLTETLQKTEQSNKQKLDSYFRKERKSFGAGRRSSKAAMDYYKSMNRSNVIPPQFMDQKK